MKTPRPFYFIVVVWGKQFCDYLTDYCIPSLLALDNIPKLKNCGSNKFIICTTPKDWEALQKHPTIIRLKDFIELFWIEIPPPKPDVSSCQHMGIGHKLATEMCFHDKAYSIPLTPDMLISNGTIEIIQNYALAGKYAVLCAAFRFAEEPFFATLNQLRPNILQTTLDLSSRQLVALCLQSFHSETESYDFESPNYTFLRPVALWRVPNDKGLLIHSLSWAPLLIDYGAVRQHDTTALENWTMDGDYIYKNIKDHNKIHVSQDSDEMMILSWSPLAYNSLKLKSKSMRGFRKKCCIYKNRLYLAETLDNPIFDPLKLKLFYLPVYWHVTNIDDSWYAMERKINKMLQKIPHSIIQRIFHYFCILFHYSKKMVEYSIIVLLACFGNQWAKQRLSDRVQLFMESRRAPFL